MSALVRLPRGCCQSQASLPAKTGSCGNFWAYFCLSGVFPAWGGYFGPINTTLFLGAGGRGARWDHLSRFPSSKTTSSKTRQELRRADVENKSLGNYWHPLPPLKPAWGEESGRNVSQSILETLLYRNAFDKVLQFCFSNKRDVIIRRVSEVLHHKAEQTQLQFALGF